MNINWEKMKKLSPVIVKDDDINFEKGNIIPKNDIKTEADKSKKFLLNEISSKYLIEIIDSYIKDDNYIYKLLKYNKSLQKKFNILLTDYKERFYNKNIRWEEWINIKKEEYQKIQTYYKEKDFNYFIFKYYQNLKKVEVYKSNIYILLTSPFLYTLAKLKNFGEIFIFNINLNDKRKNYVINEINKLNINSLSIKFSYNNIDELCNMKELDINLFSKIKKLKFNTLDKYNSPYDSTEKYSPFFKYIFSLKDIINNLVYLKFEFAIGIIKRDYIEKINELKSLKYLKLTRLKADKVFELKLNNLERLSLSFCSIFFKNKIFLNLKQLKLKHCGVFIKGKKYPLQECPKLEDFLFEDFDICNAIDIIIDLPSIINLRSFKGHGNFFISLGNSPIEKAIISKDLFSNLDQIIKKICSINTLKEVQIYLSFLQRNNLSIKQTNNSIQKMIISERAKERICDEGGYYNFKEIFSNLISLISVFPNLVDFCLDVYYRNSEFEDNKFMEFLGVILEMKKIKKVNICFEYEYYDKEKEIYTIDKLVKLFPEVNFSKFEEIFITCERPLKKSENKNKRDNNKICCII